MKGQTSARDRIARRCYKRALARSANVGCLPLEADDTDGRSCWHCLLLLGATLGALECAMVLRLEPPLMA